MCIKMAVPSGSLLSRWWPTEEHLGFFIAMPSAKGLLLGAAGGMGAAAVASGMMDSARLMDRLIVGTGLLGVAAVYEAGQHKAI